MNSFQNYKFADISSSIEKNIYDLEQSILKEDGKKIILIAYEEKDNYSTIIK